MRKEVERGRMTGNRKLICYELNEVPWRVVDKYVRAHPGGSFEYLLGKSECYTSNTIDGGELHPWTTWPTVHRGVANQQHRITSLNQDLAEADYWPPVWQLLSDAGVDVGICGSLQSYPPTTGEGIQFFIPDTFAAGPETVPERYSAFQKLNLMQTRANTATASRIGGKDAGTALGILRSGIRPSTGLKVAKQETEIVLERLFTRWPNLQANFDLSQPDWSSRLGMRSLSTLQVTIPNASPGPVAT